MFFLTLHPIIRIFSSFDSCLLVLGLRSRYYYPTYSPRNLGKLGRATQRSSLSSRLVVAVRVAVNLFASRVNHTATFIRTPDEPSKELPRGALNTMA
jgi:hypothetical protein